MKYNICESGIDIKLCIYIIAVCYYCDKQLLTGQALDRIGFDKKQIYVWPVRPILY